jgi:membrane-associated phospholipid phosphatase
MQLLARQSVDGRIRTVAAGLIAGSVLIVVVLGVHYAHTSTPSPTDRHLRRWLTQLHIDHAFAEQVADLGNPTQFVVMIVALVATLIALRRWRLALLGLTAPPLAAGLTELVLKPAFDRRFAGALAFPSAHSTAVFAVAFVVVLAVADLRVPRFVAVAASVLALGVAIAVAAALVITGRHYATDTVGGAAVALATVLIVGFVVAAPGIRRTAR